MERRTWIAAGAAATAAAVALTVAVAYSSDRSEAVGSQIQSNESQIYSSGRERSKILHHEIEEQVTRDSDTYRHDLYEVTKSGTSGSEPKRRSVAHALLKEKGG
jgi:hypothetical protein